MKIRVLLIDDNYKFVDNIKEGFKNNKYIDISYIAYNGQEGINKINDHNNDIDIIILDLVMPKKDGISVLRYLYEKGSNKKVIVLSSYNEQTTIRKVAELGASYFLIKPFEKEEIEKKIMEVYKASDISKSVNLFDNNIKSSLAKLLHELGVPSHIKGYTYLIDGIIKVYKSPDLRNKITRELYPIIANTYNTKESSVERNIRHAIEVSWNRGNWDLMEELFGNSIDIDRAKPTNSEYIITIAEKLRLEYGDYIDN